MGAVDGEAVPKALCLGADARTAISRWGVCRIEPAQACVPGSGALAVLRHSEMMKQLPELFVGFFSAVVEWCFCWGFCKKTCAERGGFVVNSWWNVWLRWKR